VDNITIQILGVCAAIIIPLLFVAVLIKDTAGRRILLYFCWGTLAGFLSYIGNSFFADAPEQAGRVTTSIAPIVEEFLKGLPVLLFLNRKKHPRITEIIVSCSLAGGAGFSIQESIFYFFMTPETAGNMVVLVIRTMTTALMHSMATAILGIGLLILQNQRHILLPATFSLFTLSTSVHALFNLLLPTKAAFIAILMPVGLYFAGMVFLGGLRKENE